VRGLPTTFEAGVVAAQNGELVAQHEDLDVLVCLGAGEQRYPAHGTGHDQVRSASMAASICSSSSHLTSVRSRRIGS
jgi:hypothetical protein